MNLKLNGNGFNIWKNLTEALKIHENSKSHRNAYQLWIEAEIRMNAGETIDKQEQKRIEKESLRWRSVLERLMNITLYLQQIIWPSEVLLINCMQLITANF